MGSRIMHLIIGHRIAEKLNIEDRTSFLLGSLAPDAVETKEESHFYRGDHQNYTRYINYHGFIDKYKQYSEHLYILGYFAHLIADDQWLKGFYIPWLRNRMEADAKVYSLYHHDFRILNGKLLEHYGCSDEIKNVIIDAPAVIDLEEVRSCDVLDFVPYALGDMDYKKEVAEEPLNVFSFIQIEGYIETSVNIALMHLQNII